MLEPIYLGTDVDNSMFYGPLTGDLDDVRFYARVLAADEIALLAAP